MVLKYIDYCVTHFQLTKWYTGIINQLNNFNVSMVFLLLHLVKRARYHVPWQFSKCNCFFWTILPSSKSPIFIIMSAQWGHHFLWSGYFSPPTRVPPLQRYNYWLEYHMLVLFLKTQFLIWNRNSETDETWIWISGAESGYDYHWATLQNSYFLFFWLLYNQII